MIRINKPAQAPAILRNRGRTTTHQLCEEFDDAPQEYLAGDSTFEFDSGLYGAKSVKNALIKAQHGKCCSCESKLTHIAYGDVEHFRPKGGYRQQADDELGRPGYYWLAYEWSNLFLCCQLCNQRFKRNLFPLENPSRRARSHRDDVRSESALFIDPAAADPALHIAFREEYAFALPGSAAGRATIDALGLNREELVEIRRDRLALLKRLVELRDLLRNLDAPDGGGQLQDVEEELDRCVADGAEYAAMARALVG